MSDTFGSVSNIPVGVFAPQADIAIRQSAAATENQKIDKSAKDFESILLSNWLEQSEKSFASVPGDDDDDDSGKEQYQGIAMQSLGAAMSASGGIGIAKMIATHLHKAEDDRAAEAANHRK